MRRLTATLLLFALAAQAEDVHWDSAVPGCTISLFDNAACWDAVIPDTADRAVFSNSPGLEVIWGASTDSGWQLLTGSPAPVVTNRDLLITDSSLSLRSDLSTAYTYKILWDARLDNATLNLNDPSRPMVLKINKHGNDYDPHSTLKVDNGSVINVAGYGNKLAGWYMDLTVGESGDGSLNLSDGGQVYSTYNMSNLPAAVIGEQPGSSGTVTVDGIRSRFAFPMMSVGRSGTGGIDVTNRGVIDGEAIIGENAGSFGTVNVSGAGSAWENAFPLNVGYHGNGTLNINNGASFEFSNLNVGVNAGSEGTVTLDAAVIANDYFTGMSIGPNGTGTLNILNGTALEGSLYGGTPGVDIGLSSGGSGAVVVDGAGSSLSTINLRVGEGGDGSLTISNGGSVDVVYINTCCRQKFTVGQNYGATGSLIVDGPDSSLTTGRRIELGEFGSATMEVRNGASVYADGFGGGISVAGFGTSGTATLIVDGPGTRMDINGGIGLYHNSTAHITNGATVIGNGISQPPGGTLYMDSGRMESWQLNIKGDFNFTGGIIAADHYTSTLNNQGGVVNPAPTAEYLALHGYVRDGMEIWEDYIQSETSALVIEIDGFVAREQYDQLEVGGTATLDGHLEVVLNENLTINEGDTFDVVLAETITGRFATVGNRCISDSLRWTVIYKTDPGGVDKVRLRAAPSQGICVPDPKPVEVDVDPWDTANEVDPDSNNLIYLAVLGKSISYGEAFDFDVTRIDPDSLRFGAGEAANIALNPLYGDYNDDTSQDAAFIFRTEEAAILCGQNNVTLSGETFDGELFTGTSPITTVDCETGGCHP